MKRPITFFAGIIIGALVTGILVNMMASKMWMDKYVSEKAAELSQTMQALEELRDDNGEKAVAILEKKMDAELKYKDEDLGALDITEGTRKLFRQALDSAVEYRARHPKNE